MRLENVADRAAGYGMPGVRVDGNDPLAVAAAVDEALARARRGDGPTFIECVTLRFRGQLVDDGICTDDELNGIDEGALISVEKSLKAVLSAEAPSAEELDRDVYATPIRYPV